MTDSDKPISFLVRGTMPRRPSNDIAEAGADADIEPRGLPPPRLKTPPPPRPYRVKRAMPDPSEIVALGGFRFWMKNGVPILLSDTTDGELRIPRPKSLKPLPEPCHGVSKFPRGRHPPKKNTPEGNDDKRKHPCPVNGCGKVFTKRTHLSRHIESLHMRDEDSKST